MTFYFYDLETSGFNPRDARIMQFAGQRTDLELKPIGEPHNVLLKLTDEIVPDPDAVLVTGITPQATLTDGITEAEFLKIFTEEIATPDTIMVGYNSIRFDDEFVRYLHYRNFYDPYTWQWQDGRSRWDMLDVVRMTRALRPDEIEWPFDSSGKPSNRLELLTSVNRLNHENAHDALSDVHATMAVARLIYNKQTKLFEYLLSMREKQKVSELVCGGQPFVYTSGKYSSEYEKTTIAAMVTEHPQKQGALVFDLRHDPDTYAKLSVGELAELWKWKPRQDDGTVPERLPVKTLQFNRCPAVAPLGVLDASSQERLKLDLKQVGIHYKKLREHKDFAKKLIEAVALLDKDRQSSLLQNTNDVDTRLYDGFFANEDKTIMRAIRIAPPDELTQLGPDLKDERLRALLPLYKARNYPQSLSSEEREKWEEFRVERLVGGKENSRLARYFKRLQELAAQPDISGEKQYLLEELQLYGQSIMPEVE